jgi:hypothetical protein
MILAAFDEKWSTQCCCCSVSLESKPAFHGPVPAGTTGLLLFRFEGAALWPGLACKVGAGGRIPGDVPAGLLISVAARVPLCRTVRVEPMCAPRPLRRWVRRLRRFSCCSFRGAGLWTAHPVQAPAGVLLFMVCTMRCALKGAGPGMRCAAP